MYTFLIRRGLSHEWAARNPVLKAGEPGIETDTDRYKIGDGSTAWVELPYYETADRTHSAIQEAVDNIVLEGGGVTQATLDDHILSQTPHLAYDDGPSLTLLYQNAKV